MRNLVQPGVLLDAWLEMLPTNQARTLSELHALVMQAVPTLRPDVKWGNLVYVLDRRALLALTPYRRCVQLQLFVGHALARRYPSLDDAGPGAGQLQFRHGQALPADWLIELVRHARELR